MNATFTCVLISSFLLLSGSLVAYLDPSRFDLYLWREMACLILNSESGHLYCWDDSKKLFVEHDVPYSELKKLQESEERNSEQFDTTSYILKINLLMNALLTPQKWDRSRNRNHIMYEMRLLGGYLFWKHGTSVMESIRELLKKDNTAGEWKHYFLGQCWRGIGKR